MEIRFAAWWSRVLRVFLVLVIIGQSIALPVDVFARSASGFDSENTNLVRQPKEELDAYLERVATTHPELFQQAAMASIQDAFNGALPQVEGEEALEEQIAWYLTEAATGGLSYANEGVDEQWDLPLPPTQSQIDGDTYRWHSTLEDEALGLGSQWQLTAKPGGDTAAFAHEFEQMVGESLRSDDVELGETQPLLADPLSSSETASFDLLSRREQRTGATPEIDNFSTVDNGTESTPAVDHGEQRLALDEPLAESAESAAELAAEAPDLEVSNSEYDEALVKASKALFAYGERAITSYDFDALRLELSRLNLAERLSIVSQATGDVADSRTTAARAEESAPSNLALANLNVSSSALAAPLVQAAGEADLGLTVSVSETANFGQSVTYSFTMTNQGPDNVTGLRLVHTLPAGGVYDASLEPCQGDDEKVTCNFGQLDNGATKLWQIPVTMKGNGTVTATAKLEDTGGTTDPGGAEAEVSASTVVTSSTRMTQTVGSVIVAANSFETFGTTVTAKDAVALGFAKDGEITYHLQLSPNGSVTWKNGQTAISGSGTLSHIQGNVALLKGDFTIDASEDTPLVKPGDGATSPIDKIAGLAVDGKAAVKQIDITTGDATITANIGFNQPGLTTDASQMVTAVVKPGEAAQGVIEGFSVKLGGLTIAADQALLAEDALTVAEATLTMTDTLGGAEGKIQELKITSDSVSFGGAGVVVPIPDVYPVGMPITKTVDGMTETVTPTVALVENTATIGRFDGKFGLTVKGSLQLSLPNNERKIPIEFQLQEGGEIEGKVEKLDLTIAGQDLTMKNVSLGNGGLAVEEATLTLKTSPQENQQTPAAAQQSRRSVGLAKMAPSSLAAEENTNKRLTVIVKEIKIDGSGLKIGGAGITNYLPDVKIGDTATISKLAFTVVVNDPTGDASFELALDGNLDIHIEGNKQTVQLQAKLDKEGNFTGTLDTLSVAVAQSTLALKDVTFDRTGFSAISAKLTLPPVLGSAKATVEKVRIDEKGLSFGDASASIPIEFTLGGSEGSKNSIQMKGDLSLKIAEDRTYGFGFEGMVTLQVAGQTAEAEGKLSIDQNGSVDGSVKAFKLTIAGMELAIKEAKIADGTVEAAEATLSIPKEWGGLSASVYAVKVSKDNFSIGGGSFKLPEIKAGDIVLALQGTIKEQGDGYIVAAGGTFKMPNMDGAGCSGISVAVELFASSTQQMAMNIQPVESPPAPPTQLISTQSNAPQFAVDSASAVSLELRKVSVGAQCNIKLGTSGFQLTRVEGTVELSANVTKVNIKVTMESVLKVGSFNALTADGDLGVEYVKDPYKLEMGVGASMKIFSMFEAARARATMRFTDGEVPFLFKAEMNINAVIAKGDVKLTAWTKDGSFHLVGSIYGQVGVRRGAMVDRCVDLGWFGTYCLTIPSSDIFFGAAMEFGEFRRGSGTEWGFKAEVEIAGQRYGIYVDAGGGFSVGNVQDYRTIDTPTLRRARALQQVYAADVGARAALTAEELALMEAFSFGEREITIQAATVDKPGDLGFTLVRAVEDADVDITLVRPDGLIINSGNAPSNVVFQEQTLRQSDAVGTSSSGASTVGANNAVLGVQTIMNVTNAQLGEWKLILNREPTREFMVYVDGTIYGPPVERLSVAGAGTLDNLVDVTWTQTTELTTTATVYATQDTITTTASYTDTEVVVAADGRETTQEVPIDLGTVTQFNGLPLQTFSYGSGSQTLTERLDLSELRSGQYHLWLEVDDGQNPPARKYFPTPVTVWHEWQDQWQANLAAQPALGGLTLSWQENLQPDADGYEIELVSSDPNDEDIFLLDVGSTLSETVTGLTSGQPYSATILAYDTGTGRVAYSEELVATPLAAPFTLAAAPAVVAVDGGQAANVALSLATAIDPYPSEAFIEIESVPEGFDLLLPTDFLTPTLSGAQASLIITASASLPDGVYNIELAAYTGGDTQTLTIPVTVREPKFTLSASQSSLSLPKGGSTSVDISALYQFGESDEIDVDLIGFPVEVDWAFTQPFFAPGGRTTLLLTDTDYLDYGEYELTVLGTDFENEQNLSLPLIVSGFALSSDRDSVSSSGGSDVFFDVTLDGGNWNQPVTLAFEPDSLAGFFAPQLSDGATAGTSIQLLPAAAVEVQVPIAPDVPPGIYELDLVASSGGVSERLPLYLTVQSDPTATDLEMGYLIDEFGDVAIAGEVYSYTLSPRNFSANRANSTTITETSKGTQYLTLLDAGGCASSSASANETQLVCATAAVEADSDLIGPTITWQVDADAPDGELVTHLAQVGTNGQMESSQLDNLAEYVVEILRLSDLSLDVVAQDGNLLAGEALTYVATVRNQGPSSANNVVVEFFLPEGSNLVAADGCTQDAELVSCKIGDLAVGAQATLTSVIQTATDEQAAIEAFWLATSDSLDDNFDDNVATVYSQPGARADLAVTVSTAQATATEGEIVDYFIDIRNQGPSQATDVGLTLLLPAIADVVDVVVGDVSASPQALTIDAGGSLTATLSLLYVEDSAGEPLQIEVEVDALESGTAVGSSAAMQIINAQPTVILADPQSVEEGSWGLLRVDIDDAGGDYDPLAVVWDLDGDGAFDDSSEAIARFDARAIDGPQRLPIAVRVTDDDGGETVVQSSVLIKNAGPVVDAGRDQVEPVTEPFELEFAYIDPLQADGHSAEIDWGDGTVNAVPLAQLETSGRASHTFSRIGNYTVNVCVADDDGQRQCDEVQALAACVEHGLLASFDKVGPETLVRLEVASGNVAIPAGLPLTLYNGNGALKSYVLDQPLAVGQSRIFSYRWPGDLPATYSLRIAVDDDGTGAKTTPLCSGSVEINRGGSGNAFFFLPLIRRGDLSGESDFGGGDKGDFLFLPLIQHVE